MTDTTDIAALSLKIVHQLMDLGCADEGIEERAVAFVSSMISKAVEAERQRAEKARERLGLDVAWQQRALVAEKEIAALKGDQVPDGYIFQHPSGKLFWSIVSDSCANDEGVVPYYLTPPQKPVVLPTKRQWVSFYREGDPNHCPAHHRNEGYLQGIFEMTQAIEASGGIVKDGE